MDTIGSALAELSTDVNCRRCGYNLRGLLPTGKCPECGIPAIYSLRDFRLRYADPSWVARLRLAAKMPAIALWAACFIVGISALIIVPVVEQLGFAEFAPKAGLYLILLIGFSCSFIGVWLLTTPCPAFSDSEHKHKYRMIARICTVIVSAGTLIVFSLYFLRAGTWVWLTALLVSPFGLAGLIGAWAVSRYLHSLAELLASDFVMRKARNYFVGFAASWLFFALSMVTSYFTMAPLMCLGAVGGVGVLAYGTLLLYSPNYLLAAIEEEIQLSQVLDQSLVETTDKS